MRDPDYALPTGSAAYLVMTVAVRLKTLRAAASFAATVVGRFFLDQYAHARRLRRGVSPVRVKNIEHPLDACVPIRYEAAGVYLTFVKLWIGALSYFRRRLGRAFDDSVIEFLAGLGRCYSDAGSVYGRCLSTTRRPDRAPSLRLAFVYAVDPHLFCVPSLHVLVVCYTYFRLRELLAATADDGRFGRELDALRARAVEITESILFVRQHSVNCIPTALAMLSVILPGYDEREAKAFMAELFSIDVEVDSGDRARVVDYMAGLYDRVAPAGGRSEDRYDAIVDFLEAYDEPVLELAEA
ncbi:MAG TPA: hypothetical protein P5298_11655 [Spirochaetia bacterium]|nr:hypothetical protein [Spirochaetales bacterium]HRW25059.1 hypothetical protein [Spirochaetia bacterium]